MDNEGTTRGRRSWFRWALIGGGVAAVVVAIVVVAIVVVVRIFLFVRGVSRPGEFVPSSALLYSSINLRPGVEQLDRAFEVGDLLQTDDLIDERDDLMGEVEDETGIHPLDDVTPWLGTDITFAVLDADEDEVRWVLMAQVSNRDAAADFVEDLLDYIEDEYYTDFDEYEMGGADVWVADDEDVAVGLTDEYLLLTDGEETMEDMLDNLDSPPSRPLAEDELFIAARESMPEDRVMFLYAQVEDNFGLTEDILDLYGETETVWNWFDSNAPEYLAVSASFIDKGLRVDVVAEAASRSLTIDSETQLQAADVVPEETIFLLSYAGMRDAWDELRDTLEESAPSAAEELDQFLEDLEDETGVALETDVIESLTGEVSWALLPSDIRFSAYDGELDGVIDALLIAGLQDSEGIEDAMDSLTDWIEDNEIDTDRESVGDYDAVTIEMDQFNEGLLEDYEAGFVITDEWLAMGTSLDSLEAFHESAEGGSNSLKSADKFSDLINIAPSPLHLLLYADIAGIVEMVEAGLEEDELDDYRSDVQPFVENLNSFMVASSLTEERWHFTAALTLQE